MSEADYKDLLDLILHGKMKAGEAWSAQLQTQLCYELKTFLLAGHETSAAMLTYTLLELISDSKLRQRVVEEADRVLGPAGSKVRTCSSRRCMHLMLQPAALLSFMQHSHFL